MSSTIVVLSNMKRNVEASSTEYWIGDADRHGLRDFMFVLTLLIFYLPHTITLAVVKHSPLASSARVCFACRSPNALPLMRPVSSRYLQQVMIEDVHRTFVH